jgi:hypothetical protein
MAIRFDAALDIKKLSSKVLICGTLLLYSSRRCKKVKTDQYGAPSATCAAVTERNATLPHGA